MNKKRLHELVSYDPETGIFIRKVNSGTAIEGDVAGGKCGNGYILISLDGKQYSAHRLAWMYMHGSWPAKLIDHINGDKTDNRIQNLREATHFNNICNKKATSKSGFKGVTFWKRNGSWKAQCQVRGVNKHLGYYKTPEEAHAAYVDYAKQHHGEFLNV